MLIQWHSSSSNCNTYVVNIGRWSTAFMFFVHGTIGIKASQWEPSVTVGTIKMRNTVQWNNYKTWKKSNVTRSKFSSRIVFGDIQYWYTVLIYSIDIQYWYTVLKRVLLNFIRCCLIRILLDVFLTVHHELSIQGVPGGMWNTSGECSLC